MNAASTFLQIKEFWLNTAIKYANKLKDSSLSKEEKIEITKKMLMASRDFPVDGFVFPCDKVIIEGNDKICVKGTILDISDSSSSIYSYYKTFVTCAKILLMYYTRGDINRLRYLWDRYIKKDIALTEQVVVDEILNYVVKECFDDNGAFDTMIEKAKRGEWKIGV